MDRQLLESISAKMDTLADGFTALKKQIKGLDEKTDRLQVHVVRLDEKVDQLQVQVARLDEKNDKLQAQVASLEKKTDQICVRIASLEDKTDQMQTQIAGIDIKVDKLEKTVAQQQKQLDFQILKIRENHQGIKELNEKLTQYFTILTTEQSKQRKLRTQLAKKLMEAS